jgi:hypothetical protein
MPSRSANGATRVGERCERVAEEGKFSAERSIS